MSLTVSSVLGLDADFVRARAGMTSQRQGEFKLRPFRCGTRAPRVWTGQGRI